MPPHRPFAKAAARAVASLVAAAFVLMSAAAASAAAEESVEIAGHAAVVWFDARKPGPQPVVVFSHGMYMCPTQSRYLMHALADAGYFVVAPRHADSNCQLSLPAWSRNGFKPSLMWSESDYRDRAEDIRVVVAALAREPRFRGRVDMERLALAGHSLGGYTVLGLGGAWPSWTLEGVRAILALSPYSWPFQRSEGLRQLKAPVMYQTGSWDMAFTLPLSMLGDGYGQSPAPKYLVEIDGATHLAWTDIGLSGRDAIVGYAVAFLDRYVKGAEGGPALAEKLPGVATFVHEDAAD